MKPLARIGSYLFATCLAAIGSMLLGDFILKTAADVFRVFNNARAAHFLIQLMFAPYYPAQIAAGFVLGYAATRSFRLTASYWVWVLPALRLSISIFYWRPDTVLQGGLGTAFHHFFMIHCQLPLPPNCADQFLSVAPFYASLAYTLGALLQQRTAHSRPRRMEQPVNKPG